MLGHVKLMYKASHVAQNISLSRREQDFNRRACIRSGIFLDLLLYIKTYCYLVKNLRQFPRPTILNDIQCTTKSMRITYVFSRHTVYRICVTRRYFV